MVKQLAKVIDFKKKEDEDFDSLDIVEDDHDTSYYQRDKEIVLKGTDPADIIKPIFAKN